MLYCVSIVDREEHLRISPEKWVVEFTLKMLVRVIVFKITVIKLEVVHHLRNANLDLPTAVSLSASSGFHK